MDFGRDFLRRFHLDVRHYYGLRALHCEPPAQGAADSISTAGYDDNLAFEFHSSMIQLLATLSASTSIRH
jgi:hypothetical protein